jgi:hypothetical protein
LLYLLAGCYDALSGKVLAEAGHKAAFVSGYAVRPAAVQKHRQLITSALHGSRVMLLCNKASLHRAAMWYLDLGLFALGKQQPSNQQY